LDSGFDGMKYISIPGLCPFELPLFSRLTKPFRSLMMEPEKKRRFAASN
jgi:hypothetical protein